MLVHGADSTWTCFARGSLRPFYVNHLLDRLKPTRLRLCTMTSFRESSMTSSRIALSSVVHDRRTRSLKPTAGRAANRLTRRLERVFLAVSHHAATAPGSPAAASASAAVDTARKSWCDQRRCYRQLRNQKCVAFWSDKLTSAKSPPDMWSTVESPSTVYSARLTVLQCAMLKTVMPVCPSVCHS